MYGFVITTAGESMLARASAGETLTITGVQVGKGVVASAAAAKALTALVDFVANATSSEPAVSGSQLSMIVEYRNDLGGGLDEGFDLSEFGIFASVGDDSAALLYYASLGDAPQPVQPESAGLDVHRFPVAVAVTGELTVTLDYPAGAFVSADELDGYIPITQKGAAGGVASLGSDGKIPEGQLPSMDYLPTAGGTMTGAIAMGGNKITGLAAPTENADAATKKYVDDNAGGKRAARFTVGTSTAGWTAKDCDYLCDGTADDVEINAAIQALPSTGGEIVILDGTYNITAAIAMNKDNVKLSGNGAATILKRMWGSLGTQGVITISAPNGGCCVENLCVDGNKETYTGGDNQGIFLNSSSGSNNIIKGNICNNNSGNGIFAASSDCTVADNICNDNSRGINLTGDIYNVVGNVCNYNSTCGIYFNGDDGNVVGNVCNGNTGYGIHSASGRYASIIGNTCNDNSSNGMHLYGIQSCAVTGNACASNAVNGILLTAGYYNAISGNLCNVNGSSGIIQSGNSSRNTITGNACYGNGTDGIYISGDMNTVTGNVCMRGTGTSSNYTSSQYTIRCAGDNNLIVGNNIMGKNYTDSGTGNTWANNKYN